MLKRKITIKNPIGLHLKPAGMMCNVAIKYDCKIHILFRGTRVNAKSVLSVLAACIKCGDEIELICDGADEEAAMQAMADVIEKQLCDAEHLL